AKVDGVRRIGSDLSGKRLELLKEALPGAERVAVLWNRPSEGSLLAFRELELASGQVGVSLQDIGVSDPVELRDAVESAVRTRVAAGMGIDDPGIPPHRPPNVSLASGAPLPLLLIYFEYTRRGGPIAHGARPPAIYWRGAVYVDRILRGAKPSDLPVEQPSIFELVINLRTAKAFGLDLAPTLLARANRVIE